MSHAYIMLLSRLCVSNYMPSSVFTSPFQDSISMCLRIHQRNMEQLRACSVNTAASFLSDATKIDSQTHVSVIFKSEIDNCL